MHSFEKLKHKLSELFQLDQADLDFGIYRIMNTRRDEINRFMGSDLLPQVREAFGKYKSIDKAGIQKELDKVVEGVEAAGMDPEQSPKVKELRARLAEEAVDITALENEVYDHLYSFFSRYYDEGDFISLRRYKEGVYAIPYEGEEVKLHWANHDQYYIKTTEYFRDYAFKIPSGHRVHFKIAEADTEKDNIKAANGNDRRFLLHGDKPVVEESGELVIRFEYRADGNQRRQDVINVDTATRVIAHLDDEKLAAWKDRLSVMWKRADGKESDKTILDKHLFDYTKRNTFDYFIHKDLEGFLRRELDFYIKNEVMRLDDIEEESAPRVEQYLSKIKVIRRIAHKIIDFLAQIENFQKKLWLKKKFVIETNYCVTLDRVPEALYPEIAANDAQREEWVRLFAIDEIKMDLAGAVDFSEPLTVEFLKANPFLVLDTKYFGLEFKDRLLASFEDIDGQRDGLLIHSENFQALSLIQAQYRNQVKCVYIDPPYNTGSGEFLYKDGYKTSSWFTMIYDRARLASQLLSEQGLYFLQIGDDEVARSRLVMERIFPERKNSVVVRRGIKNVQAQFSDIDRLNQGHDTIHVCAAKVGLRIPHLQQRLPNSKPGKWDTFWRGTDRPTMRYELFGQNPETGQWRWEKNRAKRASANYAQYLANEAQNKELDEWYAENLQAGVDLDFVQLNDDDVVQYYVPPQDFRLVSDNWLDIPASGSETDFAHEKSLALLRRVIQWNTSSGDWILDYFSGSGSMSHAALSFGIGKNRRHIAVEMGDYFDSLLLPRMKRVLYSDDWKNGKPVSREGISHMFKYIRLESYEDALANIELQRTDPQQLLLHKAGGFRESYMLKYMLDVESRGSQTLLNIDHFDDPWNYKLLVGAGSVGETKPVNVDLVETFNWLLGLKVKHIDRIGGFQVIEGENPTGEKVLVIWRKFRDLDETDIEKITAAREQANRELETFFMKQQYNTLDSEFDLIYVNGDNNLMNVPLDPDKEGVEPRYKVRLIEQEFKRLMFDVKEI